MRLLASDSRICWRGATSNRGRRVPDLLGVLSEELHHGLLLERHDDEAFRPGVLNRRAEQVAFLLVDQDEAVVKVFAGADVERAAVLLGELLPLERKSAGTFDVRMRMVWVSTVASTW